MKIKTVFSFLLAVLAMPVPCLLYEFIIGYVNNGHDSVLWRFPSYPAPPGAVAKFALDQVFYNYIIILPLDLFGALFLGIPLIFLLSRIRCSNLLKLIFSILISTSVSLFVTLVVCYLLIEPSTNFDLSLVIHFMSDKYNLLMTLLSTSTFFLFYFFLSDLNKHSEIIIEM